MKTKAAKTTKTTRTKSKTTKTRPSKTKTTKTKTKTMRQLKNLAVHTVCDVKSVLRLLR